MNPLLEILGFGIWVLAVYLAYRLIRYAVADYRKGEAGLGSIISSVLFVALGLGGLFIAAGVLWVLVSFGLSPH